jgi:hypothetical protein
VLARPGLLTGSGDRERCAEPRTFAGSRGSCPDSPGARGQTEDAMRTAGHDGHRLRVAVTAGAAHPGHANGGGYADNSGYNACLDDAQIIAETDNVVTARGLPRDFAHIYVMYLPKHVESCCFAVRRPRRATSARSTSSRAPPTTSHGQAPSGAVYANMPFPIYGSPVLHVQRRRDLPGGADAERRRRRRHGGQPRESRLDGGDQRPGRCDRLVRDLAKTGGGCLQSE